jgi:AcrR family transcriptional regulator
MAVAFAQPEVAEQTDRRVLRSRQMLVDAFAKLLRRKDFDDISIQEITNEADLTRATFYLHFADKAALLQAMAATRFGEMLNKRGISRIGSTADLKAFVEGVCEYLAKVLDCQSSSDMPLERAVIPVMEGVFRAGAKEFEFAPGLDPDTYGTAMAWAIYGAANRWARTPNRISAEKMAKEIAALLKPIMQSATPARSR